AHNIKQDETENLNLMRSSREEHELAVCRRKKSKTSFIGLKNLKASKRNSLDQKHFRQHMCSYCKHRSNWTWDISKHIKVAHPNRQGVICVTLPLEEAKRTYEGYMTEFRDGRRRSLSSSNSATSSRAPTPQGRQQEAANCTPQSKEGYLRPFKCSECGHRSNWRWYIDRHIRQTHDNIGSVIELSLEEAAKTIEMYKLLQKKNQTRSPAQMGSSSVPFPLPTFQLGSDDKTLEENKGPLNLSMRNFAEDTPKSTYTGASRCQICGRYFEKWSSFLLHMQCHTERPDLAKIWKHCIPKGRLSRKSYPLLKTPKYKISRNTFDRSIARVKLAQKPSRKRLSECKVSEFAVKKRKSCLPSQPNEDCKTTANLLRQLVLHLERVSRPMVADPQIVALVKRVNELIGHSAQATLNAVTQLPQHSFP
ncbi:hypothetical protein Ciccas_013729, partial [Cichlidogyrus casuarinus]